MKEQTINPPIVDLSSLSLSQQEKEAILHKFALTLDESMRVIVWM